MRRKVLTVCILLAICLSVGAYAEEFRDGDTFVTCAYLGTKQEYRDWKQDLGDALYSFAQERRLRNVRSITKLSNNDVRLINKALQMYEVMQNEIYLVTINDYNTYGSKAFYVLIKSKGQWDCAGIEYSSL